MKIKQQYIIIFFIIFSSCIKDEFVDFEEGTIRAIALSEVNIALLLNESSEPIELEFKGFSIEEMNAEQIWESSDEQIASVSSTGVVTANEIGQTSVWVRVNGVSSDTLKINVVADEFSVAIVEILTTDISLQVDSSLAFTAIAYNVNNEEIPNTTITWESTNANIASIDSNGLVTGLSAGSTEIIASYGAISSIASPLEITDGSLNGLERTGTFSSSGGYNVKGTATLKQVDADNLELSFSDDFSTSNGPGIYVYLSTTSSGSISNGGNGIRVSDQLKGASLNGERTYTISTSDAQLDTYDFVVIYCEPFGLPFGNAPLN